jgi:hypothetical protein
MEGERLTEPGIARIEWLDIRAVWKNEAADFTPWLLENVDVLRDALGGLDLELERAEHPVGAFSLDLIGTDLTHGTTLIVENQIEVSDHGHLGQLLTYTAGTDAGTIIWVAKGFRDEHRVALDWLNEHTGEGTRFFGVVVRALRVGSSRPAPFLELAVQPNDWQKSVRRTTPAGESSEAGAYRAFWKPLRDRLLEMDPRLFSGRADPKSIWLSMNSPLRSTNIYGEIGAGELRAVLDIETGDRQRNLELLQQLETHRTMFEAELGPLDFVEGNHRCRIVKRLTWEGKLLTQPQRHDEARVWFDDSLRAFRRTLDSVASSLAST